MAGGTEEAEEVSARRKRWNAICSKIARPHEAPPAPREKTYGSREERIIQIVNEVFGSKDTATADDAASDVIIELWETGRFGEDFDAVREYAESRARAALTRLRCQETKTFSQLGTHQTIKRMGGEVSYNGVMEECFGSAVYGYWMTHHPSDAFQKLMALEAIALTNSLPNDQRLALHILAGGGTPIDVAREMGLEPWDAIRLIKEARSNIHRVDPSNDDDWTKVA